MHAGRRASGTHCALHASMWSRNLSVLLVSTFAPLSALCMLRAASSTFKT